jgi:hypothetical protein
MVAHHVAITTGIFLHIHWDEMYTSGYLKVVDDESRQGQDAGQ